MAARDAIVCLQPACGAAVKDARMCMAGAFLWKLGDVLLKPLRKGTRFLTKVLAREGSRARVLAHNARVAVDGHQALCVAPTVGSRTRHLDCGCE